MIFFFSLFILLMDKIILINLVVHPGISAIQNKRSNRCPGVYFSENQIVFPTLLCLEQILPQLRVQNKQFSEEKGFILRYTEKEV